MRSLFQEMQIELGLDDVALTSGVMPRVLPNALSALGLPKSACRYSMPADQLDAKHQLKARVKSGVGSLDAKNES